MIRFNDPVGAHRTAKVPVVGATWRRRTTDGEDLSGVIFHDCIFDEVTFRQATLAETLFAGCRFEDCVLEDCHVVETRWVQCAGSGLAVRGGTVFDMLVSDTQWDVLAIGQSATRLVISESTIERLSFEGEGRVQYAPTVSGCTFGAVHAHDAEWRSASAVGAVLAHWSLGRARFERCSFVACDGRSVDLSQVVLEGCNLYRSDLAGAVIRDAEGCIFAECNLEEADCEGAKLGGALFAGANARGAQFRRGRLDRAMFPKANLAGACFEEASARESVWGEADLEDADMRGLDASRGSFRQARMKGAGVAGARLVEADLHGVREALEGADVRNSRGTIEWRAKREAEAREQQGV